MQKDCFHNMLLFLIAWLSNTALCQDCEPEFRCQYDDVLYEPAILTSVCNIRGQPACITDMEYILYQKYVDVWYTVAVVNTSNHLTTPQLPNGYSLTDRSEAANVLNEYRLQINPAQIEDSGNWRCAVQDNNGGIHHSVTCEVKIATTLTNDDIDVRIPPEIVLGTPASYTCISDRVYPNASVQWNINEIPESGSTQFVPNGIAFDISNTISHIFMNRKLINVKCEFDRDDLDTPAVASTSADNVTKIYAPATIDDHSLFPSSPNLDDTLTLSCTASGTNAYINWFHKDDTINRGLFTQKFENITGNFTFGEETAHKSTLTWIPPTEATCENVNAYNGEYKCSSNADRGIQVSQTLGTVDVQYPPVVPNSSVPVEGFIGDNITLNCHVDCAMPEALTYLWMREDNQEDIGENTSSIVITVTEEYFNATIRCTVNNDVGTNSIRFTLSEKEPSTPTLAISSVPISTESPGNNSDLDTGAKLAIGLSVGVILFGIIISSFVFYNRTGCYKKQRTSLQHNAYENEDITLDDHTDVTPYEQVNGIGYEPDYPTSYVDAKPPQSYVNVKPTSYVNVKSTNYANINPTSYVNVNAMEPSKYEQLKLKNSGNIEISTYEDLNGKAK